MNRLFMRYCILLVFLCLNVSLHAQEQTGYVSVDSIKLYYKVFGNRGKPLLMINGGPGFSSNYLDDFAQQLADDLKRRVVLFDQRGTGNTVVDKVTKRTVSLSSAVQDIDALRRHLRFKKWDILGHAFGGALAMLYVAEYSENVDKLILSSSIGMNFDFVEPMLANLKVRLSLKKQKELNDLNQQKVAGAVSDKQFYKQRFDLLADAYVYDQSKLEEARNMIKMDSDFNLSVNQVLWDQMVLYRYDVVDQMKHFGHKVLILHGRQDVIGEEVPLRMAATFPNAQLIMINQAARYLWLDQPELYFQSIAAFLD